VELAWLFVALTVIVAGAGVARWVFRLLGLPGVVGELLLGVALAPLIVPAAAVGVDFSILETLAWIGLVLFVFQVGLEMRWSGLEAKPVLRTAGGGLVLPLAAGMAVPLLAPEWFFAAPSFPGALLVGIALTLSALPVLARILEDLGAQGKRLGPLALASATLDDAIGWVLLAFVSAAAAGSAWGSFVVGLAMVGALGLLVVAGQRLDRRDRPWHHRAFTGVLAFLFATAALTEASGLGAVLGALAVGAALSQLPALQKELTARLGNITRVLLLPVFFVTSGAAVQLGDLTWLPLLVVLAVASASKVLGASLGARSAGVPWRDALGLGALLNARGAVALVVVKVGFDAGILTHAGYSLLVAVVALTTLMAPLAARWILKVKPEPAPA
jgi:Kef-type K+ transport system membrane component KefB